MDYNNLCGIINIYKEKGYTSHDVVAIVRKMLGRVKAGHTGTLDPQAEGVLPICIGRATKISEYIASEIKGYRAVVNLGFTTDTEDHTGEILTKSDVTASKDDIIQAILSFKGEILQTPPMYSAIKINGQKLYDLARKGKTVERKQRAVTIYNIDIVEFLSDKEVLIDVLCSKGTYIRTLCKDIGEKLGCGANMGNLLRTRTGNFFVENSIKLDSLKLNVENNNLQPYLITVDKVFPQYRHVSVLQEAQKYVENGNKISFNFLNCSETIDVDENVFVYDYADNLVGLYVVILEEDKRFLKPAVMLR